MENETELEKARRQLDDAVADRKTAMARLIRYEASNPGAMDAGQLAYATSLNNMVITATSRLEALESNRNQRLPGICILT